MESIQQVRPVCPAAGYQGGKRNLAKRICAIIDRTDHDGYAEPFVGMGGIFLRRSSRARAEFINDISGDVANFFRIVQRHYRPLMLELQGLITCRAEFDRQKRVDPSTLTDIERAARFLYLQRLAFGGKVVGQNFGISPGQAARFNAGRLDAMLAAIHERLAAVVIEQLPFDRFIASYDRPRTLFYLDPPYFGGEKDYGPDVFARSDFERLAAILAGARGKFILSLNDRPEVREIFAAFEMREMETTYTIGTVDTRAGRVGELLISNFAPG